MKMSKGKGVSAEVFCRDVKEVLMILEEGNWKKGKTQSFIFAS